MSDHLRRDVDRRVGFAVVYEYAETIKAHFVNTIFVAVRDGVHGPYEVWKDSRAPRCRSDGRRASLTRLKTLLLCSGQLWK